MRTKSIFSLLGFFLLWGFFVATTDSCKKIDVETKPQISPQERFLEIPTNSNPVISRVINNLKDQEAKKPFIENFVKYQGYPIWDYAKIEFSKKIDARDEEDGTDTLISVPVVPDGKSYVKDLIYIKLNSEILYKLIFGEDYASYGYDNSPDRTSPNAEDLVNKILEFEKNMYGDGYYLIKDNNLFNKWPEGAIKPQEFIIDTKMAISHQYPVYYDPGPGDCIEYAIFADGHLQYYVWEGNCDGSYDPTYGGMGWGGDDGGWTPSLPGGSPGGGGGSSTPPNNTPDPCNIGRGWIRLIENPDGITAKNPCTGTNLPIPPPEPTTIPPPVLPDDIPAMLNSYQTQAVKDESTTTFNLANTPDASGYKYEWGFVIVRNGQNAIVPKNRKRGTDENHIKFNFFTYPSEILLADEHTHQDENNQTDPNLRPGPDAGDVIAMRQHIDIPAYVSFINCKNVKYALVIENAGVFQQWASQFITKEQIDAQNDLQNSIAHSLPNYNTNYQEAMVEALISMLYPLSDHGIGIYKADGPNFNNFVKLN